MNTVDVHESSHIFLVYLKSLTMMLFSIRTVVLGYFCVLEVA